MPQARGTVQYASAGYQFVPGERIQVRGHVHVPGGDVSEHMPGDVFGAPDAGKAARIKRTMSVPFRAAAVFLGALMMLQGALIIGSLSTKASLTKEISAIRSNIAQLTQENSQLSVEVAKARESTRICFKAVQEMSMVNGQGVDVIYVTVPTYTAGATENSPLQGAQGNLSGSR